MRSHETFSKIFVKMKVLKMATFEKIFFFTFKAISNDRRPTSRSNQWILSLRMLRKDFQKVWFEEAWELTFQSIEKLATLKKFT